MQRAVARVATYSTLHLYRGELFTRNVRETGELSLSLFTKRDFDALPPAERERYVGRLDLQEAYCRQKWDRGDTVVLAMEGGKPAGILWCARTPVYVPDIGREVQPRRRRVLHPRRLRAPRRARAAGGAGDARLPGARAARAATSTAPGR